MRARTIRRRGATESVRKPEGWSEETLLFSQEQGPADLMLRVGPSADHRQITAPSLYLPCAFPGVSLAVMGLLSLAGIKGERSLPGHTTFRQQGLWLGGAGLVFGLELVLCPGWRTVHMVGNPTGGGNLFSQVGRCFVLEDTASRVC